MLVLPIWKFVKHYTMSKYRVIQKSGRNLKMINSKTIKDKKKNSVCTKRMEKKPDFGNKKSSVGDQQMALSVF